MDTTYHILVKGIEIEHEEIEINSSLTIRKIPEVISIFDLAAAGSVGFHQWSLLDVISRDCNIEFICHSTQLSGFDALNRGWLLNVMLILRNKLAVNCIATSDYSWTEIAGYTKRKQQNKLPRFNGRLLDYHSTLILLPQISSSLINNEDIAWIKNFFESANNLANSNNNFHFAIETLSAWRYTSNIKSSIALIWAAIESIIGVTSEITFRLSLNIASLLKQKGSERLKKFNEVKKLYVLRSKIVHGSKIKPEEMNLALKESFELLRDIIIYMIENNKVITDKDFEQAIFY